MRRGTSAAVAALSVALLVPVVAHAHIERASYWPDPAADCSIKPCTGGKVPKFRSLASALEKKPAGDTRVVCRSDSLALTRRSIRRARKHGYDIRPYDHRPFSRKAAKRLLAVNQRLKKRCRYSEIQPAVMASHNNDRVVVMPGLYTEPTARKARTNDPACDKYRITNDKGSSGAVSYDYQVNCPDDQNLIAVIGREPGKGTDPQPPREDRHGIPNLGPCVRCNLQIEGSGVSADDVVVDGGDPRTGNQGPAEGAKDVGIRADRADGFALRNMTVRHVNEHDIYVIETDGYNLDRFKTYYGGEYGVLTFVGDHGVMQNCEAVGNGDSGLYPGAGAEGGAQRREGEPFRYTQRVTHCDSHHNAGGYSGTDGNSTHVDHNNFYDNALGFTTDVFTAAGHPGFPQDSDLVEYNTFFDNNFNPYAKDSDVVPSVPVPVGTGLWIAGGNDNVIRYNRFYDNWRRGAMLFAVPDATVCGTDSNAQITDCDPAKLSTSYRNQFYGNTMGIAPDGSTKLNGTDWWWDAFPGTTGNCWYDNQPAPNHQITSAPENLPGCGGGKDPSSSMGLGSTNEAELLGCFGAISQHQYDPRTCPWFVTPQQPSSARAARRNRQEQAEATERLAEDPAVQDAMCELFGRESKLTCAAL